MENKSILVLGGTGKTGRRVANRLLQKNVDVRIGSRGENPPFDWENAATWKNAVRGMRTVYITFQPDLAVPAAEGIIREFTKLAAEEGIEKMVLLSGRGEHEAQVCEKIVMATASKWTIVRASWFSQNFSESFFLDPILAGHVALPQAQTPEPFIDVDDIADVVVEALMDDKHSGQIYELTGPRLITFEQAIAEISKAVQRPITFQAISLQAYEDALRQAHVPEDYIALINYLFSNVLDGRNASITHDIEKILGRKAKDFSTYVQEANAAGVWNALKVNRNEK